MADRLLRPGPLEADIGVDPLLADVAWSWLIDALDSRHAAYHSASGTATKTLSKGFGSLAEEGDGAQIEPAGVLVSGRRHDPACGSLERAGLHARRAPAGVGGHRGLRSPEDDAWLTTP